MKIILREDIPDYISRYGKHVTKALFRSSVIQLSVPSNAELISFGFNKKCLNVVKTHIKNGKMPEYLNKTNGKVKKKYYGVTINKYIDDLCIEQNEQSAITLKKIYNRFFNIYKLKFEDVDMDIDPITCEVLYDPCYIIPDWTAGNKIIYNWETLRNCREIKRVYTGFDVDENGQEYLYYRDVFTGSYVSPFTKRKFDIADVRFLSCDILE